MYRLNLQGTQTPIAPLLKPDGIYAKRVDETKMIQTVMRATQERITQNTRPAYSSHVQVIHYRDR